MKQVGKKLYLYLIIISATMMMGCSGAVSPDFSKYKMALSNQMQDMLDVLFAGHYNQFMSTYVDPAYIKSMGGVDKALLQFDNSEQQRLYADLKLAKNITPFYDPDVNQMVYQGPLLLKPIAFVQKSGKWYMMGDWFKN